MPVSWPVGVPSAPLTQPKVLLTTAPFGETWRTIPLDRPMTVGEVIAVHGITFHLPTIAVLISDGEAEPIMRSSWHARMVGEGQTLTFMSVPRGGNGGGKQIIGLIASIALAVAAPYVGGAVAGALNLGATGKAFASIAFIAGGTPLLDAAIPPPKGTSQ